MDAVDVDLPWDSGTLWGAYVKVCPDVDAYRFGIVGLKAMVHSYMWNMSSQEALEEP